MLKSPLAHEIMKTQKQFTGTIQLEPNVWQAWLDGQHIADFTSKGAAEIGVEVEKKRQVKRMARHILFQESRD
jgi:hypothetical protein